MWRMAVRPASVDDPCDVDVYTGILTTQALGLMWGVTLLWYKRLCSPL